jgi:hypothetical protein
MVTGMGAREQPLLLVITTAGTNLESPCYAMQLDVQKVLEGAVDEQLFGIVYTIDDGDDWTSDEALRKANPNYDVSVSGEFLRGRSPRRSLPRKQNVVKTKHLERVVQRARRVDEHGGVARVRDAPPARSSRRARAGWRSTSRRSSTSRRRRGLHARDRRRAHYYGYVRSYLPEETASDPTKGHYAEWLLERAPGRDRRQRDRLPHDRRRRSATTCAATRWPRGHTTRGTRSSSRTSSDDGVPMVEVPQRTQHLSSR